MKGYTLNLSAKTLTVTKAFEDAVSKGEGEAYDLYTKFMREIPGLTVIRKTHATPRKYTNKQDYLPAYNFIKNCGSLPLTSRYTAVRKWFVAQFPEFRKNPLFYLYNEVNVVNIVPFIQEAQERAEELAAQKAEEQTA